MMFWVFGWIWTVYGFGSGFQMERELCEKVDSMMDSPRSVISHAEIEKFEASVRSGFQ